MHSRPDVNAVVVGGRDRRGNCHLGVFCLERREFVVFIQGGKDSSRINAVDVTCCGTVAVSAHGSSNLCLWDVKEHDEELKGDEQQEAAVLKEHADPVKRVRFIKNDEFLVS